METKKSKADESRRSFYNIKTNRSSHTETKETKKILLELNKSHSWFKKYYNYDDTKYRGIRDIRNLINGTDEDYYQECL